MGDNHISGYLELFDLPDSFTEAQLIERDAPKRAAKDFRPAAQRQGLISRTDCTAVRYWAPPRVWTRA